MNEPHHPTGRLTLLAVLLMFAGTVLLASSCNAWVEPPNRHISINVNPVHTLLAGAATLAIGIVILIIAAVITHTAARNRDQNP